MTHKLKYVLPLCLYGCLNTGCTEKKPNVLFICIDDFRPEMGHNTHLIRTPNMDRLASEGTSFMNHYAVIPTSGASRCCMLSGKYPQTKGDLDNFAAELRLSDAPEQDFPETMFHHLRRNGYYTVGVGKVSHSADGRLYKYDQAVSSKLELPYSWDEMLSDAGKWETGWNSFFAFADGKSRTSEKKQVRPYQCVDNSEVLPDELTANLAVKKLKELSAKGEPFCMAVGFFKPHLPFVSHQRYWDLYDEDSIPLAPVPDIPENCSVETLMNSAEFKSYQLGDEKPSLDYRVSDEYARRLRHAYYACVSFTDDQVGKVLKALDESGLADNTIVVLWGDHGWQLGDYRVWGKHTLHDIALNSSLIVRAPGCKQGINSKRVVSSIDIYPTLMELCGVESPEGIDGKSFVTLLKDPDSKQWNDVALGFFGDKATVRTPDYRLIYADFNRETPLQELYQYEDDNFERKNIAAQHPEKIEELKRHFAQPYDIIKTNLSAGKR